MSLDCVTLNWEVYHSCITHSLSTEKQEIMGLLLGYWNNNHNKLIIEHSIAFWRNERKNDRVEISSEQLAQATMYAETLSKYHHTNIDVDNNNNNNNICVVGWYHSHPHFTVHPSHVDVRTQGQYQMMDSGFIGLIFSVFREPDAGHLNTIVEVSAFQSIGKNDNNNGIFWEKKDIPLYIISSKYNKKIQLNNNNNNKEKEIEEKDNDINNNNNNNNNKEEEKKEEEDKKNDNNNNDIDSIPLSKSRSLSNLIDLFDILISEERNEYINTLKNNNVKNMSLEFFHNSCVYQESLCHLIENIGNPLLLSLERHLMKMNYNLNKLKLKKQSLINKSFSLLTPPPSSINHKILINDNNIKLFTPKINTFRNIIKLIEENGDELNFFQNINDNDINFLLKTKCYLIRKYYISESNNNNNNNNNLILNFPRVHWFLKLDKNNNNNNNNNLLNNNIINEFEIKYISLYQDTNYLLFHYISKNDLPNELKKCIVPNGYTNCIIAKCKNNNLWIDGIINNIFPNI